MNKKAEEQDTTATETLNIHGASLSRRSFLGVSGSLLVSLALKPNLGFANSAVTNSLDAAAPNSWVEIHADNTVVIRTGKCDFGQSSIYTAYRQIVAEELGIPVDAITTVISGDTDRTPDGGGTFGLLRTNVLNLRKVAAYTREAVLKLAAQRFGVSPDSISIKDGILSAGSKRASYGEIVAKQALTLEIPVEGELTSFRGLTVAGNPPLKDPADYTVIGTPVKNPIVRPKVSGELTWVGDVKLPGMLHARVIHPATLGSTLVKAGNVDKSRFPNAQVVAINNLVAVVSPDEWEAVQAANAVAAVTQWSDWAGLPGSAQLQEHLRSQVDWNEVPGTAGRFNSGDAAVQASRTHAASYFVPYHKHAPIGPTVSLAEVTNGTITVHTHSQNPQFLRMAIAKMLGESEAAVVIRTYPGPGHFGRSNGGNAGSEDEAVLLARKLNKPVRVQWMRHDDMQWSTQSSAMLSDIRIDLNDSGKILRYEATHFGPPMQDDRPIGALLANLPTISSPSPNNPSPVHRAEMYVADSWVYAGIANVAETGHGTYQLGERESPLKVGLRDHSMRTPIQFQQNFPRESAITEAAALAGTDALEFRLQHATDPRFQALLTRLQKESQWQTRPSPAKEDESATVLRGRGVSIMFRDNGYWACAATIAVTPATGVVKVEQITLVADPGIVVNPLQLKRQAEAGCLMGVSQALHEEVAFDQSRVTSSDWYSYPILTMAEVPKLNVVIAPFQGAKIYGQGSESANALVPSAIAGAFFDATGKPARRLPLRPDYIKTLLL
ncbi:xanthine dehydrogenase family protein molybdopterin-binding subunit [Aestuariicella hydrocarbonica]|uniref:Xanthine dehydrogenase family protein molybdopterin-binding subunit n=1 Tax=Pseudomaricurvus hydrocarbonicus TaxID=1470433 RepID=A0A9E5MMI1_9GAMM|nr:molybdopterin cofactor-binding domain-containing protein [Aestuariicella hydrocarbonica]NHO66740.1 xanthine dehydrogenase family protein molybdopterin-binding subunit [Aestuariicella hydrocarbonica]